MRVLVVDDSPANRKVAKVFLEREGHVAIEASGGLEAIDLVQSQSFDVVLMDIAMPQIDGLETTHTIRRLPAPFQQVPIVAWTAHDIPGMRLQCASAGMDGYLTKPVQRTPLVEKLQEVVAAARNGIGGGAAVSSGQVAF